jgi:hypothetical protein
MKKLFPLLLLLSLNTAGFAQKKSPIDGNWILVEKNGQKLNFQSPQFKSFNQGYYSIIIMKKDDGSFQNAYAGTFEVNGKQYFETFKYGSNPKWFGWKGQQEWSMKGDTLIMVGHKKVWDPEGKELPGTTWGQFVDKWVRVK